MPSDNRDAEALTIKPKDTKAAADTSGDDDGSMDTILASIRRILNEDEAAPAEVAKEPPADDMLILENSMLAAPAPEPSPQVDPEPPRVEQPERREPVLRSETPLGIPPVPAEAELQPTTFTPRVAVGTPDARSATGKPGTVDDNDRAALEGLVAARTRAAAEQSFEALHAALRREDEAATATAPPPPSSPMLLRSGGPSLEDLVREELRGLLSAWLDQHLPSLVEALVRSQIEKIVRRGG